MAARVVRQIVKDAVQGRAFQAALRQSSLMAAIHGQAVGPLLPFGTNHGVVPLFDDQVHVVALGLPVRVAARFVQTGEGAAHDLEMVTGQHEEHL